MRSGRNSPRPCGSGLKYKRCCGTGFGRGAALAQLQNAAALIPALRPRGVDVLGYAARAAEELRPLCDALARHLPLPSLPRASRIVGADCRAALADDDQARRVAVTLLLSHVGWLAAAAGPQTLN
jgi:SEC-C motif